MARPKKQTIDYFPHDCHCSNKKTLYILEQKHGNDGYAFWFKLLELLGATENHVLDCKNPATWQFLQAKTRLNAEMCEELLGILSDLNAIDSELWTEKKIWCQNFIDRISDVYKNRRVETPIKPGFYRQKPHKTVVSTDENPQSKVKETKVKESIYSVCFENFWHVYPIKKSKVKTYQSWNNQKIDNGMSEMIIHKVKEFILKDKKFLEGYAPHPATFINQKRWEDEIEYNKTGTSKQSTTQEESSYTGLNKKNYNEGVF